MDDIDLQIKRLQLEKAKLDLEEALNRKRRHQAASRLTKAAIDKFDDLAVYLNDLFIRYWKRVGGVVVLVIVAAIATALK